MTKDEFQKTVDDVVTDCIRNDYSFGSYARKVTDAVWPVLEAAEEDAAHYKALAESALRVAKEWEDKCDELSDEIKRMYEQKPAATVWRCDNGHIHGSCERALPMGAKLYALPGAKGEEK